MVYQLKLRVPLSKRFIMPSSKKEQGQALILLGLAIILGNSFDNIHHNIKKLNGDSAIATLEKTVHAPNRKDAVYYGIYHFQDRIKSNYVLIDKTPSPKEKFKETREVVWDLGKPQEAIFFRPFLDNIKGVLLGILVLLGGVFIYKAKDE